MIKIMKIEVLFPEVSNIYGDFGNIMYLKKCMPNAEIIETNLGNEPHFINENIDLVYLGSMTEKMQERVIKELIPYKDELNKKIQDNQAFLFTGNAFEVIFKYIEKDDGTKIQGLNIVDVYAKRQMMKRFNSLFLGEFNGIKIVGFKDQFSHEYGDNSKMYFAKAIRGCGLNPESKLEGIKINNFIGTSILGPILVLNPNFTKYLMHNILKQKDVKIAYEEEAIRAYNKRLQEFEDKRRAI